MKIDDQTFADIQSFVMSMTGKGYMVIGGLVGKDDIVTFCSLSDPSNEESRMLNLSKLLYDTVRTRKHDERELYHLDKN